MRRLSMHRLSIRQFARAALRGVVLGSVVGMAPLSALAQSATPAGLWKTIDDETRQVRSLVRIAETNGVYTGTVEKIFDPDIPADATCVACTDDRKDRQIVGMAIIRNVRINATDTGVWDGGNIVDPSTGKIYRVKLTPIDKGAKLDVRGYIGMSLFGRTQTWVRVE